MAIVRTLLALLLVGCGLHRERLWGPERGAGMPRMVHVDDGTMPQAPLTEPHVVALGEPVAERSASIDPSDALHHASPRPNAPMRSPDGVHRPTTPAISPPTAPAERWNWWATGILTATVITLVVGIALQNTPMIVIGGPLLLVAAVLSIALPRLREHRGKGLAVVAIGLLLALGVIIGGVLVKG